MGIYDVLVLGLVKARGVFRGEASAKSRPPKAQGVKGRVPLQFRVPKGRGQGAVAKRYPNF